MSTRTPRPVVSPNDGRVFASWRPDEPAEVERLLQQLAPGQSALAGDHQLRRQILDGCVEGLQSARSELVALVVREVGKKPGEADAEIDYAISFLDHCRHLLDSVAFEQTIGAGRMVTNVGLGGAFLICPFNDPVAGLTRKIGPAIAAGCPAIVKPSSLAMLCARAMFKAFRQAGVGNELQLLASGDPVLAGRVLGHDDIDIVSFTGSTAVGRELASTCAANGKKAVMELGGNCPFAVFGDADPDRAVGDLLERKLKAAGQACSSVNRVLVEDGIYAGFRERLMERVEAVTAGPSDRGVDLGPVRTREAVDALVDVACRARDGGERLLTPEPHGVGKDCPFVFPLTVIECEGSSIFDRYETFGPVLSIRRFSGREDLLAQLSAERHALAAYFYTGAPGALLPHLRDLRFGSIGINSTSIQGADIPTGGFRDAGIGREGGIWGMREFLTTVNCRLGV